MSNNNNKNKVTHPMISVPEAIQKCIEESKKILNNNPTLSKEEEISLIGGIDNNNNTSELSLLESLIGRIVSKDIVVPEPGYPSFRSSIMDGYAILLPSFEEEGDNNENETHIFEVIGTSYAGEEYVSKRHNNDNTNTQFASYVTTGAAIPKDFNTVIPIEQCSSTILNDKTTLSISNTIIKNMKVGQWIRQIGSDIPSGHVLLKSNTRINDIAQLAVCLQCGIQSICCYNKIRIGVLSSGNELLSSNNNTNSKVDGIVDVNRPILHTILHKIDPAIDVIDIGIVPDIPNIIENTVYKYLNNNNLHMIISTGGVSMGEKDYFESIVTSSKLNCSLIVGRMHMKPGKPTKVFNYNNQCIILALPGNPVSAFVCANLLVYPILNIWQYNKSSSSSLMPSEEQNNNNKVLLHPEIQAIYKGPTIILDKERPEYHRVSLSYTYSHDENTTHIIATSTGKQRSSMVMSLIYADGVMCLPQGGGGINNKTTIIDGEQVLVLLFNNNNTSNIFPLVEIQDSKHINNIINKNKQKIIYGVNVLFIGANNNDSATQSNNTIDNIKNCVQVSLGQYYDIHNISTISIPLSSFSKLYQETSTTTNNDNNLKEKILQKLALKDEQVKINIIVIENKNYQSSLLLCNLLSKQILVPCKDANALALQARRGAATISKNNNMSASSALFETFICWFQDTLCMVLPYDEYGSLEGSLHNISNTLLGHIIKLGSGGKSCSNSSSNHEH